MSEKRQTADERLMAELYKTALQNKNLFEEIDVRPIMHAIGQKDTAIKTILKHLAQANFILKIDTYIVKLTPHGVRFCLQSN